MVGIAHAAVDDLSLGKIGADMRAVSALHDRLTFRAPINDDPRAEKIAPDDGSGTQIRGQHQRVPVLQIGSVVLAPILTGRDGSWQRIAPRVPADQMNRSLQSTLIRVVAGACVRFLYLA